MTVRLFCENFVYHNRKSTQSFDTRDRAVCGAKDFLRNHRKWFRVKAARAYLSVRLKINPSTLLLLPSTPPSPTPLTLSWWSDKNPNNPEGESGILTMAGAHNWQEPLTAPSCPSQAPFEPLSPLQLPPKPRLTSPASPTAGLRPESGRNVENYLLLVHRGRGMPGMGQRISAMPRILRMRGARSAGPVGAAAASIAVPARRPL